MEEQKKQQRQIPKEGARTPAQVGQLVQVEHGRERAKWWTARDKVAAKVAGDKRGGRARPDGARPEYEQKSIEVRRVAQLRWRPPL